MNSSQTRTWQLVTDDAAFRALQGEWEQLFSANPVHRPFQAWGWVTAWLAHLAGTHDLHVICLRDDRGQLQLVLPLVRSTGGGRHRAPRLYAFCGYGPECSDHLSILRLPALNAEAAALAAEGIAATCDAAARIELGNTDGAGGFAQDLVVQLGEHGRLLSQREFAACPVVSLADSWDGYLNTLSSNFRSQVRRHSKRIANHDTLRFRSVTAAEDAGAFTRELIRLNRSRMGVKGEVSSLEDTAFREFLLEAVPALASAGLAWLDVLEDGDEIVGAALNLVHGESVYFYMGGFDEGAKNLRPGTALFARVIQRCIERGHTRYDFLRGAEHYKYRWGATDEHTYHITVYPRGMIAGHLARQLDGLTRGVRGLARRLRASAGNS